MKLDSSSLVYPEHFEVYISLVKDDDLHAILEAQANEMEKLYSSIAGDKWMYKYGEDKWTIKEVVQHISDAERVFSYRAFVFSREDPNTFPGFDENEYSIKSNANNKSPEDLIKEFLAVRKSTQTLFNGLTSDQLKAVGSASTYQMSVNAMGYLIAGHAAHHINILKERYGV
ncbi:MAG: DinB family protein [Ginsengibacter sp.]